MTGSSETLRILAVGDLILDEPDPDTLLAPSAPMLRQGDVVIGQVEVPHAHGGEVMSTDVPARPSDPANLDALPRAGFTVATLAGNHIADAGPAGLRATVARLRELGLQTAGADDNLGLARCPARVTSAGRRVAVLSYNCVGPRESWAGPSKAGAAYLNVLTHYELDHASPGGPPTIYTFVTPQGLEWLREDISAARANADTVVVVLHKGIGHLRAQIAMYERELGRVAAEAGADIVLGHHAHILRGIEVHRGVPIFHGLGNFVTVTRALTPTNRDTPEAAAWARRRQELFGFTPDPEMPTFPFHPESRNTLIADFRIDTTGRLTAGFVPCFIDDEARPVPLGPQTGDHVVDYVRAIGAEAGLADLEFTWDGDRVVFDLDDGVASPH